MKKIYLSVVIPCYNEERNLRLGVLEKVYHFFSRKKYSWEVILVNDGSTDESASLIKKFIRGYPQFRLLEKNHQGKAGAVSAGIFVAKGEVILFTDLDQATPVSEVDKLLPFFQQGYDVVIGSRNTQRKGAPLFRLAMARGFMIIRNLILNLGIKDTQCGFKAFKRSVAYELFSRLKVFRANRKAKGATVTAGFDVEFLYLAKVFGYKIKEVPVEWHYQETRHVNLWKDSLESLLDLFRIKFNSWKGEYRR